MTWVLLYIIFWVVWFGGLFLYDTHAKFEKKVTTSLERIEKLINRK